MAQVTHENAPDRNDVKGALQRYLEIQEQERQLKEEKAGLQATLAEQMRKLAKQAWYPELDGQRLKVMYRESSSIEYDEDLLRERLADRYSALLSPDIRKIRKSLKEITPLLQPLMDRIGSPSAEKVRSAIESGMVDKAEFAGAFEKKSKRIVSVGRVRTGNRTEQAAEDRA